MFPESSITTADRVFDLFSDRHFVCLAAPMQSGKTSTAGAIATFGQHHRRYQHRWDKVYLLCNIGDNALKVQTLRRFREYGITHEVLFQQQIHGAVKAYRDNRIGFLKKYGNSLIIIDESHIGASTDQGLHTFMSMLGVGPNGDIDTTIYNGIRSLKVPYILTMSATPYAESACVEPNKKSMVMHIPGQGYIGIDKYIRWGCIYDIPGDWEDTFRQEILRLKDTNTYAIVRRGARTSNQYQPMTDILSDIGCKVVPYDGDSNPGTTMDDMVRHRPSEFTVIAIKNYCTAGQTFSKEYISLGWETREKVDSQAQGIPGRFCGYLSPGELDHIKTGLRIWCKKDALEAHTRFIHAIHSHTHRDKPITHTQDRVPSSGSNIKKSSRTNKLSIDPGNQVWRVYKTLDEVKEGIQEVRDMMHMDPRFQGQIHWYQRCPKFGINRKGIPSLTMEQAADDRGFIHQYLPADGDTVGIWSVQQIEDYVTHRYPLLAAKLIGYTDTRGRRWKAGHIAKVAYEDINDPSTRRYVLYGYNGPVWYDSSHIHGVASDNSMYMQSTGPNTLYKSYNTIEVPDDMTDDQAINQYDQLIKGSNTPLVFMRESEAEDIPLRIRLQDECANEAYDRLQWVGKCTSSLSILQPYIDERMTAIEMYTPSNCADGVRSILKEMGALSPSTAVSGRDINSFHGRTRWGWKTQPSVTASRESRAGVFNRVEGRPLRYYL